MIDIGGGSTTVAVFEQGHLKETAVIPLGGENITKDVSIGLRTSTEEAERVKKQFGHAFYDEASEDEVFEVTVIGTNQKQSLHSRKLPILLKQEWKRFLRLPQPKLSIWELQICPAALC